MEKGEGLGSPRYRYIAKEGGRGERESRKRRAGEERVEREERGGRSGEKKEGHMLLPSYAAQDERNKWLGQQMGGRVDGALHLPRRL